MNQLVYKDTNIHTIFFYIFLCNFLLFCSFSLNIFTWVEHDSLDALIRRNPEDGARSDGNASLVLLLGIDHAPLDGKLAVGVGEDWVGPLACSDALRTHTHTHAMNRNNGTTWKALV